MSEGRLREELRREERIRQDELLAASAKMPRDAVEAFFKGPLSTAEWLGAIERTLKPLLEPAERVRMARASRTSLGDEPDRVRWERPVMLDRLVKLVEGWLRIDPAGLDRLAILVVVFLGLSDSELNEQLPKVPRLASAAPLALAVPAEMPTLQDAILEMAGTNAASFQEDLDRLFEPRIAVCEVIARHVHRRREVHGERLVREILVALGMPRASARGLFSFKDKRDKRAAVK